MNPGLTLLGLLLSCNARGTFVALLLQPQRYCLICYNLLVYGHLTIDNLHIEHLHLNAKIDTLTSKQTSAAFVFRWSSYLDELIDYHRGIRRKVDNYNMPSSILVTWKIVLFHTLYWYGFYIAIITFCRNDAVWRYIQRLITRYVLMHMHHYWLQQMTYLDFRSPLLLQVILRLTSILDQTQSTLLYQSSKQPLCSHSDIIWI